MPPRTRRRARALVVAVAALAVGVAGPAGAASGSRAEGRRPPRADEIRVGGVVSRTNPFGIPFAAGFDGAEGYFDVVNRHGGLFGKKVRMVARLDDEARPSGNVSAVQSLVEDDKVFAILPLETEVFTGARYLARTDVPTFGDDDVAGWDQGPNLFGDNGSYRCFTCPAVAPAFVAHRLGLTKVAVMAYSTPESTACAQGLANGFEKWGLDVVFEDTSLLYGFSDVSTDAEQMQSKGVQYVAACMDLGAEMRIARALRDRGMTGVRLYASQGYGPAAIERFGRDLDGLVFGIGFTPWERPVAPGTRAFLAAMKKRRVVPSEQAQVGWVGAQLLVDGIRKAGREFTQKSVIDAINAMTDFDADGILPGINWTTNGHRPGHETCTAYVEAHHRRLRTRFGQPGQPFVCFHDSPLPDTLDAPYYRPAKLGEAIPPDAAQ